MCGKVIRQAGFRIPRYTHVALALIIGVAATACSAAPIQPSPGPAAQQPSTVNTPADGCPAIAPKAPDAPMAVVIDYVDFVVVGDTTYLASQQVPPITETNLGEIVTTSRCSFRMLNDRTGRNTPRPSDGHTAYLPPGTPIYAIRGWSPSCRLAAEHDGQVHVYLAQHDGGTEARPVACAVS